MTLIYGLITFECEHHQRLHNLIPILAGEGASLIYRLHPKSRSSGSSPEHPDGGICGLHIFIPAIVHNLFAFARVTSVGRKRAVYSLLRIRQEPF
jgi:hypothetical protein